MDERLLRLINAGVSIYVRPYPVEKQVRVVFERGVGRVKSFNRILSFDEIQLAKFDPFDALYAEALYLVEMNRL